MNVLYLMRTWAMGGGQTICLRLAKHLDPARFRIVVAPFDAPGPGDDTFAKAVADQGGALADERVPWRSRRDGGAARAAIDRLIRRYGIDLVHTHDPQSNTLVGLYRKDFPCAAVASPYGWWNRMFPLRSHVYTWMEKNLALPRFERVITVSETMRREILKGRTPAERIRVIHTGVDLGALDGGAGRAETRTALGIPADAFVVGTVGRLYIEKGHRHLIEAVAAMAHQNANVYGLIVGSGPLLDTLKAQAAEAGVGDRIVLTGYYADLPGALRTMDVFALPTVLDEGFPTVSLEAQAMGLPVVATNRGGTFETMREGETGLLVPAGDGAALASAIGDLIGHRERLEAMGAAARTWVRSQFTLEAMVAAVGETYEEAAEVYARGGR